MSEPITELAGELTMGLTGEPARAKSTADPTTTIVLICGPTATGKTHLAMRLAERLDLEVVSADSVQIYRGLDIGSAKATDAERAAVPHHLIDIRDPNEVYSAGAFVADADAAIAQIVGRGRLPVVVGGTGLYVRSLIQGLSDIGGRDAQVRSDLDAELARHGAPQLHRALAEVDAEAAARIGAHDAVRIVRALEVYRVTGAPMSAHHAAHGLRESRYAAVGVGLSMPRSHLRARVNARADAIVERGLVDEVARLLADGLPPDAAALRSIGYREAVEVVLGRAPRDELGFRIAASTRKLAKRQRTWFRGMQGLQWFDARGLDENLERLIDAVRDAVARGASLTMGASDERAIADGRLTGWEREV